jgi:hypothetical protein
MMDHIAQMLAQQMNGAAEAVVRAAGMTAENEYRKMQDLSPAYMQHHFEAVAEECGLGHNERCLIGRG